LLRYDDLPPGSTIRREWDGEALVITIGAERVTARARRRAAEREAVPSALLAAGAVVFLGSLSLTWLPMRQWPIEAVAAFGAFCFAMFGFVWYLRYRARVEELARVMSQMTVVALRPGRMAIETHGLLGGGGCDVDAGDAARVGLMRGGTFGGRSGVCSLGIERRDGKVTGVMLGREAEEIEWVARQVVLWCGKEGGGELTAD
jgi:hypothetical protein